MIKATKTAINKKKLLQSQYNKSMNNKHENYIQLTLERYTKKINEKTKRDYDEHIGIKSKENPKAYYQYISCKKKFKDAIGPLTDNDGTIHQ